MSPASVAKTHKGYPSLFTSGLATVAVVVGITSLISLLFLSWRPTMDYSDFAQDYVAARAWGHGADPYANTPDLISRYERHTIQTLPDRHRDPHTPFQILLARPLNALPYRAAYAVWLVLNAAALVVALVLLLRALAITTPTATVIAIFALAIPTVRLALTNGEPNALALLLLIGGWLCLRNDKEVLGGIALGLATALRIFPILLVVSLIRTRRYRALMSQLVSAASVFLLTGLILGIHASTRFVTSAAPENFRYWRAAGHNLSLLGIPFRWLAPSHWFHQRINLQTLAGVLAISLFLFCVVAAARTPARASGDVYWAMVPWAILASPLAWADYLILLIPTIVLMLKRVTWPLRALILIPTAAVMLGRPYFVHFIFPVGVLRQVLVLAIPLYGTVALALLDWNCASTTGHPIAQVGRAPTY